METDVPSVPSRVEEGKRERADVREEMRPARGLLVGLALSAIFWLGLLVVWLSV